MRTIAPKKEVIIRVIITDRREECRTLAATDEPAAGAAKESATRA